MNLITAKNKTKQEIKKSLLCNTYFVCEQCYFRGSVLTDKWNVSSDVDILVVSSDFQDLTIKKRKELVGNTLCNISIKIDAICLSQKEFAYYTQHNRIKEFGEELLRIV